MHGRPRGKFRRLAAIALALLAVTGHAGVATGTGGAGLKPGDYTWTPELAPAGPALLVVSLREQRATLYRNGVRIAVSTVSTGRPGFETPTGIYTVLEKRAEKYSNLYDNAPMPYMQRLTWSGVALHAGNVSGYPASHGCVRLPEGFARRLFELSGVGMTVVIADDPAQPSEPAPSGWLFAAASEADTAGGDPTSVTWQPELAPRGPITILASTAERSLRVLRNGIVIGSAPLSIERGVPPGTHLLQLRAGTPAAASAYVAGRPRLDWSVVAIAPGTVGTPAAALDALYGHLGVPAAFARNLYEALRPGDTVIVTDQGFGRQTGAPPLDTPPPD